MPAPLVTSPYLLHSLPPLTCSTRYLPLPAPLVASPYLLHSLPPLACSTRYLPLPAPLVTSPCLLHSLPPFACSTRYLPLPASLVTSLCLLLSLPPLACSTRPCMTCSTVRGAGPSRRSDPPGRAVNFGSLRHWSSFAPPGRGAVGDTEPLGGGCDPSVSVRLRPFPSVSKIVSIHFIFRALVGPVTQTARPFPVGRGPPVAPHWGPQRARGPLYCIVYACGIIGLYMRYCRRCGARLALCSGRAHAGAPALPASK